MKKIAATTLFALALSPLVQAQTQSVAIGTSTTNDKAVLLLVSGSSNQGIIVPIVSGTGAVGAGPSEKGMVVFDDSDDKVKYYDGLAWITVGAGGGGSSLLSVVNNNLVIGAAGATSVAIANTPPTGGVPGQILMWDGSRWTSSTNSALSTGSVLKWNAGTSRWEPGTDNIGAGTTPTLSNGQILVGNGTTNSAATMSGDATLNVGVLSIGASRITNTMLAPDAVTSTKILDGTVGTTDLSSSVAIATSGNISTTGTLTTLGPTANLTIGGTTTFNARTYSWPAAAAGLNTFLRNDGSGNLTWAATSAALDLTSQTGVLIGNGTITTGLAASASLQYLRRNAANTAYEFATPSATDITSGTLPIARGGTGLSLTTPANGSLLIGNGTGFANALLTPGAGINVTNGAGTISISNTWLTNPMTTTGDIVYGTGATPTRLAAGTSGHVLTSQGPAAAPIWQAPAGGFSTTNVIPKGNGTTLISSSLFDNGSVGIGNTNPQANLHIHSAGTGNLRITNASTGTTTGDGMEISIDGTGAGTIFSRENAVLTLGANSNGTLYLSPTGLVGINDNNPSQPLDVAGNVEFSGSLLPAGAVGAPGSFLTSAGLAGVAPTWTTVAASISPINTVIRGDATGLLQVPSSIFDNGTYTAINRTSPIGSSRFDIGTNATVGNYGGMYIDTQAGGKPFYGFAQGGGGGAWIEWDGSDANRMKFVNGSTRMTIQSDGFVGIGTTTPSTEFEISAVSPQLTLRTTGAGVNESAILRFVNAGGTLIGSIGDSGSSTQLQLVSPTSISFNTNFTVRGGISSTGNYTINAPSTGTALDVTPVGNWDLATTEGDLKIGSAAHRIKFGVALAGGGAGDAYIASHGGTNRLFIGTAESATNTQTMSLSGGKVGIGTTAPALSALDINIPTTATTSPNGIRVSNDYSGASTKNGIYNILTTNGSGPKNGVLNEVNGLAADASAVSGVTSTVVPNGTGAAYGTFNTITSIGTGQRFGTYNNVVSAAGNASAVYGNYSFVNHLGTGTVYGANIDANKAAGQSGTLYGVQVVTDNDGTGDSFVLYGNAAGNTTGKEWGLYVTGEDENYFSNTVTFTTPTVGAGYALRITREGTPTSFWYEGSRSSDGDRFHGYNGTFKGSWSITDGVYTSSSDRRLKKNIVDLPSVIGQIQNLRPVRYHMNEQNDSELKRTGFIAQEVKEYFPEFVSYDKTADIYSLNYSSMSVIAIKAIQEQQTLIDNQQAEIASLKSDLEMIKQSLREIQSKTRQQ